MDMSAAQRRATYEDLLAVPDHLVAEILDGELIVSPRPAARHAHAGTAIGSVLFDRFDGPPGDAASPGGWCILDEPELHLGPYVLVPDVALVAPRAHALRSRRRGLHPRARLGVRGGL